MPDYHSSIVFCLAGIGKRFTDKGIIQPKYLLDVNGKSLIEESILNLNITKNNFVVFMCNKKHLDHENHLKNICKQLRLNFKIIYIDDTNGQADTALEASKTLINFISLREKPVIFFNGDTILKSRNINDLIFKLSNFDGLIDTFPSNKNCYSYIKTNKHIVTEIEEKITISNDATSGLYIFSSPRMYCEQYFHGKFDQKKEETYISEIYKFMIINGMKVVQNKTFIKNDTIVLGTYDQYQAFIKNEI